MRLSRVPLFLGMVVAFVRLVRNPLCDLSPVIRLANGLTTGDQLRRFREVLSSDPACARALEERPRLGDVDLDVLAALPEGTLGRTFADFLRTNGLELSALPHLDDDDPRGFVSAHLYETHDLWHVATGFDVDIAGEGGLQAFYQAQIHARLPLIALPAILLNALIYDTRDAGRRMDAIARGWQLGKAAKPLFGVRWAERWEQPLAQLRAELGLAPC